MIYLDNETTNTVIEILDNTEDCLNAMIEAIQNLCDGFKKMQEMTEADMKGGDE